MATIAVFSTRPHDELFLRGADPDERHELRFFETALQPDTAVLAVGADVVVPFVNDDLSSETIDRLADAGVRGVALRCAGFNHVDLERARERGLVVARVPEYSPYAVAEHCVGLILSLNRRIHRAHARVRDANFTLGGLLGFDLHGTTVGVVGTGRIGTCFARIMRGFGCSVLAHDPVESDECRSLGVDYVALDELFRRADIVALHCPLTPATHHLVDAAAIATMKPGVMLINTSRGGLVDTAAVIDGLKSGRLGHVGLDVYEEEAGVFFEDLSDRVVADDDLMRLLTFPNVLITSHQAFFTREALTAIAQTTMENADAIAEGRPPVAPVE